MAAGIPDLLEATYELALELGKITGKVVGLVGCQQLALDLPPFRVCPRLLGCQGVESGALGKQHRRTLKPGVCPVPL